MIADAHNDLFLEVAWRLSEGEANPFAEQWLPRLEAGGVGLQICPIYVDLEFLPEAAARQALAIAAAFHRTLWSNEQRVRWVRSAADLESDGRIGLMLALEGAEPLGSTPELLDAFVALGVRMVGLTWNRRNAFADGAAEPARGGLSRLGEQLVDRIAELGLVLDLAHASERTFADVLERAADVPVLVSHAGCRALRDSPRNVTDDQLRSVAERGGLFGPAALPSMIDPAAPTLERYLDHVEHAVSVMGIDHVCLGADFVSQLFASGALRVSQRDLMLLPSGLTPGTPIERLTGPADYPNLVEGLRGRGYEEERLEAILSGNLVRFLRRALRRPKAPSSPERSDRPRG